MGECFAFCGDEVLLSSHFCPHRLDFLYSLTDRIQRVKIEGVYSDSTTPRGGIPQGTKLAPLLFAILVNRLCQDWPERIKYVDDTSVFEIVPRCSQSYLPLIANGINKYATQRNMRLNEKKCKEMVITFL